MMRRVVFAGRARTTVAGGLDRVTAAVTRRAVAAGQGAGDIDLLIADALRRRAAPLNDPPAWVAFQRDAYRSQAHAVEAIRNVDGEPDEGVRRVETLIDVLQHAAPALSALTADRLAGAADDLQGRREPFVRPTYVADVAHHSAMASSGARQARVITAVVRFLASRRIIEIGTAYGLGALTLARAAGPDARVVTAERSEPQLTLARRLLADEPGVTVVGGIAEDAMGAITEALGGAADLLFHDGAHSREAYVSDFAAYEPLLAPGAGVLFDDIDWVDERFHPDAQTYAGWRAVASHRRVRAAYEIDGTWGLLLLH